MLRLGTKYSHLVHDAGCGCHSPALQKASRRLEAYSRRGVLFGLAATALSGAFPSGVAATAADRPAKTLLSHARLFDSVEDRACGTGEQACMAKTLLSHARLFDSTAGTILDTVQVLVVDNRIAEVDHTQAPPPQEATVIDCRNGVIIPGLIDAHWHAIFAAVPLNLLLGADPGIVFAASTAEAERTLMRGFTTVRDLGGPVFSFKQAIDAGLIPGPRIFPSGAMITTSGGHGDLRLPNEIPREGGRLSGSELLGGAAIVDGVGELQLRIREQLIQGASQIKLVGGGGVSSPRSPLDMIAFSEEDLRTAVGVAADWNTYIAVHAYTPRAVQRALAAGVTCIEHAHLVDEETAIMIAEKRAWLSTQPFLTMADAASQSGSGIERAQQIFAGTPKIYQYARKHGIKTAWGSDVLFSPELTPRQNIMLTHLSNWYSNAEVLQMATSGNAQLLGLSGLRTPYPGKLGVIEKGAFADLVVMKGNPIENLALIENPQENFALIMKDGRVHKNIL